jgi:hypothetical protein
MYRPHRQREVRRRPGFHDPLVHEALAVGIALDDAVAAGFFSRDVLDGDDGAVALLVNLGHLLEHRGGRVDQVVGQDHREGLVAQHGLGAQHGVPQAQRLGLAHIGAGHVLRHDVLHRPAAWRLRPLSSVSARRFVEVVFDRALLRPVMKTMWVMPAATASSTAYWMSGLSTTGSISLGLALVAGRKRVPMPATGNTALVTRVNLPPLA